MYTKARADQLQFMRFLAFMLIFIFHTGTYTKSWIGYVGKYGSANAFLLIILLFGCGLISSLFRLHPLKYLGDISFECYLIHQIVIFQYMSNSGIYEPSTILGNLFSFAFWLGVSVVLAALLSKTTFFLAFKHNEKSIESQIS